MLLFLKQCNKNLYDLIINLIAVLIIACTFVIGRVMYSHSGGYLFLIWNIFLAWLPFYFSLVYTQYKFKFNIWKYIIGLLWFIFYPNAPYMITDFIHLSKYKFFSNLSKGLACNLSFAIWYDFFLISIFVIIGLVLGFISLSIMHKYIKKKYNYILGWVFVAIICVLSSFAIYLGRFIRVNSWDIVTNPMHLINVVVNSLNLQGLTFTLLFSILTLICYLTFFLMNKYYNRVDI